MNALYGKMKYNNGMATRTDRLDLRLTPDQRRAIERAAELSGSTLTGWAVNRLATVANAELAAAQETRLSDVAFDQFLSMLDAPEDPQMAALLARTPVWAAAHARA